MASHIQVERLESGAVERVRHDVPVLDPESPEAVQVTVDDQNANPLSAADKPSPEEVFAGISEPPTELETVVVEPEADEEE